MARSVFRGGGEGTSMPGSTNSGRRTASLERLVCPGSARSQNIARSPSQGPGRGRG